jgi:hypothetical protein
VAILDAQTGKVLHVWNSLCSDRPELLVPSSCPSTQSAIWGRAGAVIDAATGDIFLATGNGPYNGKTDWGDATIELNADATRMLGNFTPTDNAELNNRDLDIGSTSPVLLPDGLITGSLTAVGPERPVALHSRTSRALPYSDKGSRIGATTKGEPR